MSEKLIFDNDWKFFLGDLSPKNPAEGWGGAKSRAYFFGAAAYDTDESDWRQVTLPHDFVSEGAYSAGTADSDMRAIPEMEAINSRHFAGGCLKGGIAWYRKRFNIPKEREGQRVYIYFDGVYRNSAVYLNEYYVGTRESGYTGYFYDITDFVNYGGENVIAVRVDSTEREGWWYEGGGIYRHVWLEYRENISFEPYGVFVNAAPDLQNKTAKIDIQAVIENYTLENKNVSVKTEIFDADGVSVAALDGSADVSAWDKTSYTASLQMSGIKLWELDEPYLYTAKVSVSLGGRVCDEINIKFGVREMRFDADNGFYLNGKNIKVKGVCLHHDHAGVGIGIPDSVHEYRVRQVKSMGANAIRSSHYPASPEMLDICDKLGVLIFEETRRMSAAPEDLECLKAMVKRDRNHASIFLWGIGNEEIFAQDRPEMARATVTMKMAVRKLDPTRPITSAVVCWNGKERFDTAEGYVPVTKNLDIMGFNYCKTAWDDYHKRVPNQPVIITEASSNSGTRGCYSTDESRGFYYILDKDNLGKVKNKRKAEKRDMAEDEWKYFALRPYLSGIFIWTGIDYRGEPTPLEYPAVYSQFGAMDYCAFPKDNFYYYKSWWSDENVLHIFPHWNHSEGEVFSVYAYSNLDEVELFVNGKSYGKKALEKNWYPEWENVAYEKGEVSAKGYKNGSEVLSETVRTTDEAKKIALTPYKDEVDANDAVIINVRITDQNGLTVPTADSELNFTVRGARILGTGNGDPGDHDSEKTPVRHAFNGLCQLIVKAENKGEITIAAASEGLEGAAVTVKVN